MGGTRRVWTEGDIAGVTVRRIELFRDARGWGAELFRAGENAPEPSPAMAYVSMTRPGVLRAAHSHSRQTDILVFAGPGRFRVVLWDDRPGSATRGRKMTLAAGERNPVAVAVPPGVIHAFRNVSRRPAISLSFPDRLYRGRGRRGPVDEIRYEDGPETGVTVPAR